jgi:hypothetical protein
VWELISCGPAWTSRAALSRFKRDIPERRLMPCLPAFHKDPRPQLLQRLRTSADEVHTAEPAKGGHRQVRTLRGCSADRGTSPAASRLRRHRQPSPRPPERALRDKGGTRFLRRYPAVRSRSPRYFVDRRLGAQHSPRSRSSQWRSFQSACARSTGERERWYTPRLTGCSENASE